MQTETQNGTTLRRSESFPPLEQVNRPTVPTEQAAHYLLRCPQTLRIWACKENGPLRPIRINGRLGWPVSELRRVLGVPA
ncbi:MAG: hypothetical protein RBT42_08330 [Aquabacterium sp.]|jgi:hypothetical protein|uniref:hypothetical protein n=1 Tax=Aquabacterium sp. TaxID=1872578 RepID=UPI002A36D9F0|nr:hypothetical protein [Aquabacterium sp.]MDX9843750.1 hypothetical protein [Aquabacterium sp.]